MGASAHAKGMGAALAVFAGAGLALLWAPAGTAAGPTVSAAFRASGYYWSPDQVETPVGGSVEFRNPSASVPHGISWKSGPGTPSCAGVPVDSEKTEWSGSCSFAQAGAYTYVCTVHPVEMTGTVYVGTSPPPPSGPTAPPAQPSGPVADGLTLARRQTGGAVNGALRIGSGAGGKLVVELFGSRSALGISKPGPRVRVGRISRFPLSAGNLVFRVPLRGVARNALRERGVLPLRMEVAVIAKDGNVFERGRQVVVRTTREGKG